MNRRQGAQTGAFACWREPRAPRSDRLQDQADLASLGL